jgi:hypothetical protein
MMTAVTTIETAAITLLQGRCGVVVVAHAGAAGFVVSPRWAAWDA